MRESDCGTADRDQERMPTERIVTVDEKAAQPEQRKTRTE
jgi:hypothetical protein